MYPGGLNELPADGRAAWSERLISSTGGVAAPLAGARDQALLDGPAKSVALEWPAYPVRIEACLGRENAMRLLDWQDADGTCRGRIRHQEEYGEWRSVREDRGLRAVELTTELPEYWEVLAGFAPARALELAAEFARVDAVPPDGLYGDIDPFATRMTPERRMTAFRRHMLGRGSHNGGSVGPVSPLNSGRIAICCMIHRDNTLTSLLRLVTSATRPYLIRDPVTGRTRHPSGSEAIRGLHVPGTDHRNSDPLLVERAARFATDHQIVLADDPVGVYIADVQMHELATPDGDDVPDDWLVLSRGLGPQAAPDGRSRYQRLRLEVPRDLDFTLSHLIVRRTGETLRYGGQLAELVQLVLHVRTEPSTYQTDPEPADPVHSPLDCSDATGSWAEFTSQTPRDDLASR